MRDSSPVRIQQFHSHIQADTDQLPILFFIAIIISDTHYYNFHVRGVIK